MRRSYLLAASVVGLFFVQSSVASVLYSDAFDYPVSDPTTNLGHNFPDGNPAGAVPNWIDDYHYGVQGQVVSGNVGYPGLAQLNPSSNSSVAFDGLSPHNGVDHHFFDQYNNGGAIGYTTYSSGTFYYSLVLTVTQNTGSPTGTEGYGGGSNPTNGSFFAGFDDVTTYTEGMAQADTAGALLIRSGDNTQYGQSFQLGLGTTATARQWEGSNVPGDPNYVAHNFGDTLLVVVSYTFNPGATDDVAKLWINPTPGSLESSNAATIVTNGAGTDAEPQFSNITNFFLRNIGALPDNGTQVDDLRIGTTWEDVTPAPEPTSLSLLGLGAIGLLARRRRR